MAKIISEQVEEVRELFYAYQDQLPEGLRHIMATLLQIGGPDLGIVASGFGVSVSTLRSMIEEARVMLFALSANDPQQQAADVQPDGLINLNGILYVPLDAVPKMQGMADIIRGRDMLSTAYELTVKGVARIKTDQDDLLTLTLEGCQPLFDTLIPGGKILLVDPM